MKDKTKSLIKERLSVLAVIIGCMAIVVIIQAVQGFFSSIVVQPTATVAIVATPTPRAATNTPQAPLERTTGTPNLSSTPTQSLPKKPINFSGKWVGSFSETIDGNTYNYQYTLELAQQGTFISGKSTIAKVDDPNTFAKFIIRGQIVQNAPAPTMQIVEDLFGAQNLRFGSAVAPRNTHLSYTSSENEEYLEGEWVDRRNPSARISGLVKLTKQR